MPRVIVVDDEAPARRYLIRLLALHRDIEVIGEASSRRDAARVIAELSPDAVFMDIELGDGDGMDLWTIIPQPPLVVFVTAHSDRAAHAFDIEALDYLLKPVSAVRLANAIERLCRAHDLRHPHGTEAARGNALPDPAIATSDSVVVRNQGTTKLIRFKSISAVLAKGDYVELRMAEERTELVYATLTRLAERLPSPPFTRLSRSVLLNLDHLTAISTGNSSTARATFSTRASPVDLGRVAENRLRKLFA